MSGQAGIGVLGGGYAGLAQAGTIPAQESVSDVIESLLKTAVQLHQSSSQVADMVTGSQPPRENGKAVSPGSLAGRLIEIREVLNSAQENIYRAAKGLGNSK